MVHIVLIRPGSTEFDVQGRIQGNLDIPLCDAGMQEVEAAIENLRNRSLGAIYCCPSEASVATAKALAAGLGIKFKPVENLRNVDQGLWQGMLIDEVKHKQPKVYRQWQEHPECVCPPDGEMLSDAAERVQDALEKVIKKHRGGAVGLVVPEPLASVVANLLKGGELKDLWDAPNGCRCCQEFDVQPTMWRSELSFQSTPVNPSTGG